MFRPAAMLVMLVFFARATSLACACGCNVFAVGPRWMMATTPGTTLSLQYNYMNQYEDWNGLSTASPDSNGDKQILTSFYTFGLQTMFDRNWGIMGELPLWNRYFKTTDDFGNLVSVTHTAVGDARLLGMYTGISEDMSTGIMFGVKLPTGPFDLSVMDRDTQIGTGTVDGLLGAYQMGQEDGWGWFGQFMWQHAMDTREGYKPGDGLDVTVAAHYDNLLHDYNIVPMVQLIGSFRGADSGINADPDDSGYQRLYLAPGFELNMLGGMKVYADVRIPLVVNVRGYQLVAPYLANLTLSLGV
jgi:hypothetical protein